MTIDPFQVLEKNSLSAWTVLGSGHTYVRRTDRTLLGVEGMAGRLREVRGAAQVSRVNLALLLVEGVARQTEGVVRLAGEAAKCLVLGEFGVTMLAEVAMGKVEQEIADLKQLVLIKV